MSSSPLSGLVRNVAASGDAVGESPVWDPRTNQVAWIDSGEPSSLNTLDWTTGVHVCQPLTMRCTAIGLTGTPGEYVAALGTNVGVINSSGDVLSSIPLDLATSDAATNDGACDPFGSFWLGTTTYSREPLAGSLWRYDGSTVEALAHGYTLSNGLAWSPDKSGFYYVDSLERMVRRMTWDGERTGQVDFLQFTEKDGLPDGIALDTEGGLWIAFWGPGAVRRYDSSGTLDVQIQLEVPNTTAVAFGGDDLSTLLITSARSYDGDTVVDGSGNLFACDVDFSGVAPMLFTGS